ncbi:hypothetical protein G6F57_011679 [Rhizopus arrhizus]|nr:hypothetical protein G6F25_011784 [Rhizopus arrhizus]KAG1272238.1 hypothetical protein G6F65_011851 [Rhizopus arrhizus]KAG1470729.1 hypothetical protein G6F57_011679 [Rhizopus arrhizus]
MRFMHTVLKGLPRCMVYLDDVILHSRTEEEHLEDLHRVLERLQSCNLKISLNKCQFFQPEVKFLGFLVSGAGIRSNPERTKVIKTWPTPTGTKALMRFLGFCVFYHKFIRDLSLTAKPLYNLLKKDVPFDWSPAAQEAFEKLKTQIMEMPTLAYPNPNQPYDLHCDASNVGLGAALVQGGRPIAFASRTLAPAEENYHTTEKECLAVRWALDHFHPLVHGAKLTVHTDHAALKSILSTKAPNGRIARWIMELQSYQFDIVHKKGILNTDADALSRLEQQDSQDPAVFGPQELKAIQLADPEIKLLLKRGMVKPFAWKNELVTRQLEDKTYKPVIPRVIVPWILKKCHDDPISGHFGVARTLDKVKEVGWWFQMKQDVETWVKHCEACQRRKIRTDSTTPGMKPITPTYLGEIWASDVAVLVDSKKGNKYMLVFMEYLSKWIVTAALPSFDSDHVIQVLLYEVVLKFGVPTRLITDNGSNYISEAMKQVCQRLGIRRSLTSVEHPQTDGLVERINRTLKTSLATCADQDALNWDEYLPFVTFAYNTAKQESTKFSPFEVMFGRKPQLPLLPYTEDKLLYETEPWAVYLKNHIPLVHGKALENIKKAQLRQKRAYNKGSKVKYDYKAGDLVARKVLIKTGFPKERWSGPWVIIKASNPEATAFHIHVKGDPNNKSTANAKFMRPWFAQDERIALVSESPSGRGDGVTFRL